MKVKELIEKLKEYNEESDVIIMIDNAVWHCLEEDMIEVASDDSEDLIINV